MKSRLFLLCFCELLGNIFCYILLPFILMSVLGNKVLIRCISSLVILPDSFNLSIFTFDSSSGISISLIKVSSNCFISSSFSRTEGNSFTLRLIPLPLASAFNLFMSPVLSVFSFDHPANLWSQCKILIVLFESDETGPQLQWCFNYGVIVCFNIL